MRALSAQRGYFVLPYCSAEWLDGPLYGVERWPLFRCFLTAISVGTTVSVRLRAGVRNTGVSVRRGSTVYTSPIYTCVIYMYYIKNTGPPSAPDRPLTGLDRIRRKNSTHFAIAVVWNIPDVNNTHVSSYVVSVDPPITIAANDGVIDAIDPAFQAREISLDLQHGQQYDISVRADSCGNTQQGVTSIPLTIHVQGKTIICRLMRAYY